MKRTEVNYYEGAKSSEHKIDNGNKSIILTPVKNKKWYKWRKNHIKS